VKKYKCIIPEKKKYKGLIYNAFYFKLMHEHRFNYCGDCVKTSISKYWDYAISSADTWYRRCDIKVQNKFMKKDN